MVNATMVALGFVLGVVFQALVMVCAYQFLLASHGRVFARVKQLAAPRMSLPLEVESVPRLAYSSRATTRLRFARRST